MARNQARIPVANSYDFTTFPGSDPDYRSDSRIHTRSIATTREHRYSLSLFHTLPPHSELYISALSSFLS
jgi:hypothetical protein